MTPGDYEQECQSFFATLQLSAHAPNKGVAYDGPLDGDDDEDGISMPKFFLLGTAGHQLWINLKYKDNFFKELKRWRTVQPSPYDYVATSGAPHVTVDILVHCLTKAQCTHVILRQFGQKRPFRSANYREPAPAHPAADSNNWDIGATWSSTAVFLFAPVRGDNKSIQHYPMVIPGSLDFGSVHATVNWKGKEYKVKIYPRLVHVIKSFNSRFQGEPLMTVAAARKKLQVCDKMIDSLSKRPASEVGGFRIEVSFIDPTLHGAKSTADSLPFYDLQWWLNPPAAYEAFKLDFKVCSPSIVVQNAKWVLQRAEDLGMLNSDNNRNINKVQKKVIADVQASIGWNAGKFKTTKSVSPSAWWTGTNSDIDIDYIDTAGNVVILNHLSQHFSTRHSFERLIRNIRNRSDCTLDCPMETNDGTFHELQRNGWDPVRMVCKNKACAAKLHGRGVYRWLAKLVIKGSISKAAIGLGSTAAGEDGDIAAARVRGVSPDQPSETAQHLIKKYGTSKESIKAFFNLIRKELAAKIGAKYLPCEKNPFDLKHHYTVHKFDHLDFRKFRLRCDEDSCRHGLSSAAA